MSALDENPGYDLEYTGAKYEALVKKKEALDRARTLIERQPCTTDMQIQVLKDLITIEELRRDWGV